MGVFQLPLAKLYLGCGQKREKKSHGLSTWSPKLYPWLTVITAGGILNSPLLLVMVFERIVLLSEQRKSLRDQGLMMFAD
ncbi:hypothetical protein EK904_002282 [Melospiza melodia maxima]|nr:hypothetical protein EK904_002282 [Melospiza melodia maxima]